MEDTNPRISLLITGRTTLGYQVLLNIGAPEGLRPSDASERARTPSKVYYSVENTPENTLIECVLPNFQVGPRPTYFKYLLQYPAGYFITNAEGVPVSPLMVLDQIRSLCEGSVIVTRGNTWVWADEGVRPTFNTEAIGAVLNQYSLRRIWGRTVAMNPAGRTAFMICPSEQRALYLNSLGRIARAAEFSRVYLGEFTGQEGVESLTEEELTTAPTVTGYIRTVDGFQRTVSPDSEGRIVFNSTDAGYPEEYFEPVGVVLTAPQVLDAYATGMPLPMPEGAEASLDPVLGSVTISFNPPAKEKVYNIDFTGNGQNIKEKAPEYILSPFKGVPALPPSGQWRVSGFHIRDFEEKKKDKENLASYRIKEGVNYTIQSVRWVGDTLNFELVAKAPAKAKGKKTQATAPEAEWTCRIVIPGTETDILPVTFTRQGEEGQFSVMKKAHFVPAPLQKGHLEANIPLSFEPQAKDEVVIGEPFIYFVGLEDADIDHEHHLLTLAPNYKGRGFFSRFLSMVYPSHPLSPTGLKITYTAWMIAKPVLFALLGLVLGFIFHAPFQGLVDKVRGILPTPTEQVAPGAPATRTVEPSENAPDPKESADDDEDHNQSDGE